MHTRAVALSEKWHEYRFPTRHIGRHIAKIVHTFIYRDVCRTWQVYTVQMWYFGWNRRKTECWQESQLHRKYFHEERKKRSNTIKLLCDYYQLERKVNF